MFARWVGWVAPLALGCVGDPVAAAGEDASATNDASVVGETSSDGGGCLLPGNLIVNGDFSAGASGWLPFNAKTEPMDGPCGGRGLRVYGLTNFGSIAFVLERRFAKGSRVRARAYFRDLTGTIVSGAVDLGFFHYSDGGEVAGQEFGSAAGSGTTWSAVDVGGVLDNDESGVRVVISSRTPALNEFGLGAVSLVVE